MATKQKKTAPPIDSIEEKAALAATGLPSPTRAAALSRVERNVALLNTIVMAIAIFLPFLPDDVEEKVKTALRKTIAKLQDIVGD